MLALLAVGAGVWEFVLPLFAPSPIRVETTPAGESIGISDGSFVFDITNQSNNTHKSNSIYYKNQAAHEFRSEHFASAKSLWQQALQEDSGDAETLIYQEDRRIRESGKNYITLVIATLLTGANAHVGHDDLQGAYVAQKEFNDSNKPFQVRLLIANSGSGDELRASQIAQQIVQAASKDKTIVGVMGWPYSKSTLSAVHILADAHIPMVSETASTDTLTKISPYFFRVIPPDASQGKVNAHYVTQLLHAKRVALFVDPDNAYSSDFADDFKRQYLAQGNDNNIVATERYTIGVQGQAQLSSLLTDALSYNPDVIYFAGYASDLSTLLAALPTSGTNANVKVVGGEGFYELSGYTSDAHPHLKQLRFLSYAYPDEWTIANLTEPHFFQAYGKDFDPLKRHNPRADYGFTRADNDAILSYDATLALLTASSYASNDIGFESINPDQIQQELKKINDRNPLQGASGQIAFGNDGDPINKPILLLSFNEKNQIQEKAQLSGCLQIDHCN